MSDNKELNANRKLDDDELEGVSGGILLNNAVYNSTKDKADIRTQQYNDETQGNVKKLGTATVGQNGVTVTNTTSSVKKRGNTTIFGQNIQNA